MKRTLGHMCLLALFATLSAVLSGCADGGVGGTGISASSVYGNVREIGIDDPVGIPITVQGTEITGRTRQDGSFELRGVFPEVATLEFHTGSQPATMNIFVMARSVVQLTDVVCTEKRCEAGEIVMSFDEPVRVAADAVCNPDGTGWFAIEDLRGSTFEIDIHDPDVIAGDRTCTDLREDAEVVGSARQQGSILVATSITVVRSNNIP